MDLIAHQGGNGEWPGETTYAFTRALSSGADVIEMDVWGTADNPPVLVLMHSSDISKVTEGSGKVTSLKFKDLERLNAAYRWSPDGGRTFPFANTEPVLRLARLEDVLKEFKDQRMNIEINLAGLTDAGRAAPLHQSVAEADHVIDAAEALASRVRQQIRA